MKIALVHDDLIQWGGAERLFKTFCEIWPEAPIYTSMASGDLVFGDLKKRSKTSFMQSLPLKKNLYRHYFFLYPLAFEGFDFNEFDIVFSSSTRFAHGIMTKPTTLHITYLNSPPRMFWEPRDYFEHRSVRLFALPFLNYLRLWDRVASTRSDFIITNSRTSQKRIKKYYGRKSDIVYPFVEIERFRDVTGEVRSENLERDYFLIVSRLVRWKRIDIAIQACSKLKLPLKIIGWGPDFSRLKSLPGPTVQFLGRLTEEEVVGYYRGCKALIFPQEEDFGITPLESLAAGRPVISFKGGGALETIIAGKVGEFFYPQNSATLSEALSIFDPKKYLPRDCVNQAEKFGKKRFVQGIKSFVEGKYRCFTTSARE